VATKEIELKVNQFHEDSQLYINYGMKDAELLISALKRCAIAVKID
jgi:hypothetical protein